MQESSEYSYNGIVITQAERLPQSLSISIQDTWNSKDFDLRLPPNIGKIVTEYISQKTSLPELLLTPKVLPFILSELIENSSQASANQINVTTIFNPSRLTIEIHDNGTGFTAE